MRWSVLDNVALRQKGLKDKKGGNIKMSDNKLKELLKKVESDPEARKKVEDLEKPADEKGVIAYYLEVAKRLGADLTEDDVREAFAERMKTQKSKTDTAVEKVEAMADDALAEVAGGRVDFDDFLSDTCMDTYQQGENCWYSDGCDHYFQQYVSYVCGSNINKKHCFATDAFSCDSAMF